MAPRGQPFLFQIMIQCTPLETASFVFVFLVCLGGGGGWGTIGEPVLFFHHVCPESKTRLLDLVASTSLSHLTNLYLLLKLKETWKV